MKALHALLLALTCTLVMSAQGGSRLQPDPPMKCESCDAWNRPLAGFKVYGNTYYVGTAGLSAVLVTSKDGHVLLDGALPQSAPLIDENIRALGFRLADVKLILNSHAHYDHAGGIAALQRASGATVAASEWGGRALTRGEPLPDDPQFGFGREANSFPRVPSVRRVSDGEVLRVGDLSIAARLTPGHTPGSTTWTWKSCEGTRCLDVVYADSLNPVSAPGFRFTGDGPQPSRIESFRRSIATVERLPCDVVISVHPNFTDLDKKAARLKAEPGVNPFIDPRGCRAYAAGARRRLDQRIKEEQ